MKRFFSVLVISAVLVSALSITALADTAQTYPLETTYRWTSDDHIVSWEASPLMFPNVTGVFSSSLTSPSGLVSFGFDRYYFNTYYPNGFGNYSAIDIYENDLFRILWDSISNTPASPPNNSTAYGTDIRPFFLLFKSRFEDGHSYTDPMYSINVSFNVDSAQGDYYLNTVPYGSKTTYYFTLYFCAPGSPGNMQLNPDNFSGYIDYYYSKNLGSRYSGDFLDTGEYFYRAYITPVVSGEAYDYEIDFMREHFTAYGRTESKWGPDIIPDSSYHWYYTTFMWTVDNSPSAPVESGWQYQPGYNFLTTLSPSGRASGNLVYSFPRGTTTLNAFGNQPFYLCMSSINFHNYDTATGEELDQAQIASLFGQRMVAIFNATNFGEQTEFYKGQFGYIWHLASNGVSVLRGVIDQATTSMPVVASLVYAFIFVTVVLLFIGWARRQ